MFRIATVLLVCLGFACPVYSASNDLSIVTVSDMVVVQKAKPYEGIRPIEVFDTTNRLKMDILNNSKEGTPGQNNKYVEVSYISGSGISTRYGTVQPALHFATIKSASSGKEVKLYVQMATTDGMFNRSWISCEGDFVAGARYGYVCGAGRRLEKEKKGEMSALVEIVFPEQKEAFVVFVGYDTTGALIPAFSTTGFERHTQLVENWRNHGP